MKKFKYLLIVVALLIVGVLFPTVIVNAASVELNKSKVVLEKDATISLKLKGAKSAKITWKSSDDKVIKISDDGKVTAVKKGTATITAIYNNKNYKCRFTVVNQNTQSNKNKIYITKSRAKLEVGSALKLKIKGTQKKVTWKSSNTKVADVSAGKVVAKKAGSAIITATVNGKKYKCTITVVNSNTSNNTKTEEKQVTDDKELKEFTLSTNKVQLSDKYTPEKVVITDPTMGEKTFTLNIADPSLVVYEMRDGANSTTIIEFYAKKSGTTTVTIMDNEGVQKSVKLNVELPTILSVDKTSIFLEGSKVSDEIKVTYNGDDFCRFEVADAYLINAEWGTSSGNTQTLVITGLITGNTNVKVYDKQSGESITISVSVSGLDVLTIDQSVIVMHVGDTVRLGITYRDYNDINYHIVDSSIISASWEDGWDGDNTGVYLTAKKKGTTTCKISDDIAGLSEICTVIVE